MKVILLLLLITTCILPATAQVSLPELSPQAQVIDEVGYTKIDIQYGRPSARGRKIMDGLVKYGKLWRTGGGPCTTIAFNQPVQINNKTIPAGIYALLTIPNKNEWTIMLNTDTSKVYGDPSEYDVKFEVVRFTVKPVKSSRFYESLTIALDIVNYDAVLYLNWENTQVHFPIYTGTDKRAMAMLDEAIKQQPKNTELLSQAAYYYFMNNKDPEQVLKWLNEALAIEEDRWTYRQKVDVLERMKRNTEAHKTSLKAIEFLKRTKPVEWEGSVAQYEERMKQY